MFEQFIPRQWPMDYYPYASFLDDGAVVIDFENDLPFRKGTRVRLYLNREKKVIGIKPVEDPSEYSPIQVLLMTRLGGAKEFIIDFDCKDLILKECGIAVRGHNEYAYGAYWSEEGRILLIHLM